MEREHTYKMPGRARTLMVRAQEAGWTVWAGWTVETPESPPTLGVRFRRGDEPRVFALWIEQSFDHAVCQDLAVPLRTQKDLIALLLGEPDE